MAGLGTIDRAVFVGMEVRTVTLVFPALILKGVSATKFAKTVLRPAGKDEVEMFAVETAPPRTVAGLEPSRVRRPVPP